MAERLDPALEPILATIAPVRREHAGGYLLTFLVAYSLTVITTRALLHLTGYPQLGNDTVHIAHALWGGLLLALATLLPLVFSNSWALQGGALVGGIGVGLFLDEVGKFISQANDYFFAPALPLIYGFSLVIAILYHLIRDSGQGDPRRAIYQSLDALKEVVDRDLDAAERVRLESRLASAERSSDPRVAGLARAVRRYLDQVGIDLPAPEPDLWTRIAGLTDSLAARLGRGRHRILVTGLIVAWTAAAVGSVGGLVQGSVELDPQGLRWRGVLLGIQLLIGVILTLGMAFWLGRREAVGLEFAIAGFLLSLVGLQTLDFYLSQHSALAATLLQYLSLQPLLIYRHRYASVPLEARPAPSRPAG